MRVIRNRVSVPVVCLAGLSLVACGSDESGLAGTTLPEVATEPTVNDGAGSDTTEPAAESAPSTSPTTTPRPTTPSTTATTEPPTPSATSAPDTSIADTGSEPPQETTMPTPPPDEVVHGSTVQSAIADLRDRLGDPAAEITVVSVEEVDWPDGSLGCPQPGMVYTQAIVNGSRIVLRHGGVDHAYHQGGGGEPFYCPADRAKAAVPPSPDLDL